MFGGVQAVTWTDVKIMVLIVVRARGDDRRADHRPARGVGLGDGLAIAAATGRLRTFDFSFDLTNQYTFWSGTIAALFLFCSYFGTDQSQVQRYLTARSVDEARQSLLMSAYWKIPLQFARAPARRAGLRVLRLQPAAVAVQPACTTQRLRESARRRRTPRWRPSSTPRSRRGATAAAASPRPRRRTIPRRSRRPGGAARAAKRPCRRSAAGPPTLVRDDRRATGFTDVNYIIPTFILTQLPIGLIGLLIVAIIMAATDTIAGELNSLSTATVIDFYKRRVRPTRTGCALSDGVEGRDRALGTVRVRRGRLGGGARIADRGRQPVRIVLLRIDSGRLHPGRRVPAATGNGAFVGLVAGMASVAWAAAFTKVAFLWHNVIGAVVVVVVGLVVGGLERGRQRL